MGFIIKLLINSGAVMITSYFLNGVRLGANQFYHGSTDEINKFSTALIVAVVLSLLNFFIKPIISIVSLPITFLTLGLFTLVINALIILLASNIVKGFEVDGFWSAFWFSIVLVITSSVLNLFD